MSALCGAPCRRAALATFGMLGVFGIAALHATSALDLYATAHAMQNDLARLQYISNALPGLDRQDQLLARQLLAFADDELGLYDEGVRAFPLDNRGQTPVPLPPPAEWQSADAAGVIARLAANRHIVLVNEAHHDAQTRELTLALLPLLRAEGYTYFAAEALDYRDTGLARRGYPVAASGTEYLHEPLYGEIIRTAIRLGFVVVPYDSSAPDPAGREAGQAQQLYQAVFARDHNARLFVHGGYAHVQKLPGELGTNIKPMGMLLAQLSGYDPLSIDQTRWRDIGTPAKPDLYRQLLEQYPVDRPSVLVNRQTGSVWSSDPTRHDVDVLLPPLDRASRPRWLTLGGQRMPQMISSGICNRHLPCVVDAHYADEPDDAIPADRYVFFDDDPMSAFYAAPVFAHSGQIPRTTIGGNAREPLYLAPGHYSLRAYDATGRTVGRQSLTVPSPGS